MKRKNRLGKSRRLQRRDEALARVKAWQSLSLAEQLKRLPPEGANRQRERITAKIATQKEAAKAEKAKKQEPVAAPEQPVEETKGKKTKKKG